MEQKISRQVGLDDIIKQAFFYWKKTMVYQFLFSTITFGLTIFIGLHFGTKYGIIDEYMRIIENNKGNITAIQQELQKLSQNPNIENLSLILLGTKAFLFPLELGLFKIYRKLDLQTPTSIQDLFAGYTGANFFIFLGYFLFWYLIYSSTMFTIILPLLWVVCTIFIAPLMFFMNQSMFRALGINIQVLRKYFIPIFICGIVAFLFKYSGLLLFGFGILLTYPFSSAMIYSLYQTIFKEEQR